MEIRRCAGCMEEISEDVCPYCGYDQSVAEQASYGLKRNSILHGRYMIGNMLGQGGFGITYIGFDMMLNIKVAIKEYYPMGYASRDSTRSNCIVWGTMKEGPATLQGGCDAFLSEARRMAQIDVLPEIVRVRDTFMDNNTAYIVMDYVQGQTLKSFLLQNGVMGFQECVNMFLPLANSLAEVHRRGLIHRDISPDNIMVQSDRRLRLLDLGAAKELNLNSSGNSQLVTKKGFSPAEQYLEGGMIGTWTDVYALCATIYYCITGKLAPASLERMASDRDPLSFDVPMKEPLGEKAKNVLCKGLAVKSENRTQTVEELIDGLEKAVERNSDETIHKKAMVKKIIIGCMAALAVLFLTGKVLGGSFGSSLDDLAEEAAYDYTQNVLMQETDVGEDDEDKWVLGKEGLSRASVVSVHFLDTLKDMPDDAWDVSKEKNGNVMAWIISDDNGQSHLYIAGNGGVMAYDCSSQFAYYDNVEEILFNGCFHTEQLSNTFKMFCGCEKLRLVEIGQLDTSNVQNMGFMFQECRSLEQLNLGSFKTDKATNMENMFCSCVSLKEIDVSGFQTKNVENMYAMFCECSSLEVLDVSGFETENVTTTAYMFEGCSSLKNIEIGQWNTRNVTDMQYMFCNCCGLDNIELKFSTIQVTNMEAMFRGCSALKQIDLGGFITSRVTNMSGMFDNCSTLKALDVSTFNTGSVTTMNAMFQKCSSLAELDVSNFDTRNVTDMSYMFCGCSNLKGLDLSGFDMRKVSGRQSMLAGVPVK